eukprot:NODE_954_length_713_cov_659.933735_g742_i0.p1 GENE.NODE_954_length_713_cov_659.933735_g742_i0~~NODE_954_length_713_cov_659.933735_g742_i0.p1  ORF type:complete len:226 (+),score=63.49 NODE_954_length_713_cov_659.933735_g742_i0:32-679(+)
MGAPSIKSMDLLAVAKSRKEPRRRCLIVGNPDGTLPCAEAEAHEVSQLVPEACGTAGNVDLATIRKGLAGADVLHIACHCNSDAVKEGGDQVYRGGLKLADQYWLPEHFMEMSPLRLSLAFLNGCNTQKGELMEEGTVGLVRSLLVSGVPGVIGTLWPVDDDRARELAVLFYTALYDPVDPLPPSAALRHAQLQLRDRYPCELESWAAHYFVGVD